MSTRSRWAFLSWTLTTDHDTDDGPPRHEAECTVCAASSGRDDAWAGPQDWCLRHAARTGHTRFRATVTGHLKAAPADR